MKITEHVFIHAIQANFANGETSPEVKDHLSDLFKRCVGEEIDCSASADALEISSLRIIKELEKKAYTAFQRAFAILNLEYSYEEELNTLNKLSLKEKEKEEIQDLILSAHLYSLKKPGFESEILKLATILIEKEPFAFTLNIDKFVNAGLDPSELPKLAAIIAEKEPYALVLCIEEFTEVLDPSKLAAIVAEKDPEVLAYEINKFVKAGLDPAKLPELAAIVAEKYLEALAYKINKFVKAGLDPAKLPELAAMIAEKDPRVLALYIKEFIAAGLAPTELPKLAVIIAEKDPQTLASNIDKFVTVGLDPAEIAAIIAEKDLQTLALHIYKFVSAGLDPAKLAAIIAEKDPRTLASNIDQFVKAGLKRTELLKLAATIADKDLEALASNIDKFINSINVDFISAFHNQFKLAMIVVNSSGFHPAESAKLAMIIAEKASCFLALYIDTFVKAGLDPSELPKLAAIIAEKDPRTLVRFIEKFIAAGLASTELPKLAVIIAEKDPQTLASNIDKFVKAGLDFAKLLETNSKTNLMNRFVKFLLTHYFEKFIFIADFYAKAGLDHEKRDVFLNQTNNLELTPLQIGLTPPVIYSLETILNLIPSKHKIPASFESLKRLYRKDQPLGDAVFQRVMERYPYYLQENTDPEGLEDLFQTLDSLKIPISDIDILTWDFKMNQSLPLTIEGLKRVEKLIISAKQDSVLIQARLALQTHEDLSEIELAIYQGHIKEPFPEKEAFFALTLETQRNFMCRAQVFRERDALFAANRIIKMAVERNIYDQKLLEYSIKLLGKTGIEVSSQTIPRLSKLLQGEFSSELKVYAAHALSQVEIDPTHGGRKSMLMSLLSKVSDENLQIALIDCLGTYQFSANEDISGLFALAEKSQNPRVLRSLAFTLSVIPTESALKQALAIVKSDAWTELERMSQKADLIGKAGGYELYTFRPSFHDSRNVMRRVIAERLVELNRSKLQEKIDARYQEYRANPEKYQDLQMLEKNIKGIESGLRYVPFQLFFPKGKVFFRGLNARKGEKLGDASFYDLLMKGGTGSADLSLYDTYQNGTWAKIGQMFMSSTREYVEWGYFNKDGVLMIIPSDRINEMQLRRNMRLQCEKDSTHVVSYSKCRISKIFISKIRETDIKKIIATDLKQKRVEKRSREVRKYKVMRRQLERVSSEARSLKDRIVYFDPNRHLSSELDRIMKEQGLSEATQDEIIRENIERLIARQLLAQTLTDPQLASCLKFASEISPLQFVKQS